MGYTLWRVNLPYSPSVRMCRSWSRRRGGCWMRAAAHREALEGSMTDVQARKIALRTFAALVIVAPGVALAAEAQAPHRYLSPDGKTIAAIRLVHDTKTGEGEVDIRDVAGASRMERSFASADGEHGLVIVRAAWTPDSEFFVFSGGSSGGHQPWHFPMFVYRRATNAIYELDRCVPGIAVVDAEFAISSPNLVRVAVATFSADRGLDFEHFRHETYSLAE